jgi:hypothetical protein
MQPVVPTRAGRARNELCDCASRSPHATPHVTPEGRTMRIRATAAMAAVLLCAAISDPRARRRRSHRRLAVVRPYARPNPIEASRFSAAPGTAQIGPGHLTTALSDRKGAPWSKPFEPLLPLRPRAGNSLRSPPHCALGGVQGCPFVHAGSVAQAANGVTTENRVRA